jgi:hypothetical protein
VKLRAKEVWMRTEPAGRHHAWQRCLLDIVDLLIALHDTVWSLVSLEKQCFYAVQLLLVCLSPPGHLKLLLLKLLL